jgi:hypothetical protein
MTALVMRIKKLDHQQTVLAAVFGGFALLVIGFAGLSQGRAGTDAPLKLGERPGTASQQGFGPPPGTSDSSRADESDQIAKALQTRKEQPKTSAPSHSQPSGGSTPAPPNTSGGGTTTPTNTGSQPRTTTPRPAPKPKPKPKPRTVSKPAAPVVPRTSSAALRSLRNGASIGAVAAAVGPGISISTLQVAFGEAPTQALLAQEPAGRPCRYYRLAAGEPSPLARLCFDANGRLLSREFVAPPA